LLIKLPSLSTNRKSFSQAGMSQSDDRRRILPTVDGMQSRMSSAQRLMLSSDPCLASSAARRTHNGTPN
jgi:hypothetical protein